MWPLVGPVQRTKIEYFCLWNFFTYVVVASFFSKNLSIQCYRLTGETTWKALKPEGVDMTVLFILFAEKTDQWAIIEVFRIMCLPWIRKRITDGLAWIRFQMNWHVTFYQFTFIRLLW